MTVLPSHYWGDLSTTDFEGLDPAQTIAVLPVAAIEQHGPHLPVCVDSCINRTIVDAMLERLPADLSVLVLPEMPVGKSNEHDAFPGTLSLSAETLIRLWTEIGESVHRAGVRKLVVFNSHGGQPQIVDIVVRDLRVRLGMFAVAVGPGSFGKPEGLFPPDELEHGIHGGSAETSIMMHARPDLVRDEKRADFRSAAAEIANEFDFLRAEGKIGFGWQTQDLHPAGACGNALDADAERGAQLVDHAADAFVRLLREVARYELNRIKTRA